MNSTQGLGYLYRCATRWKSPHWIPVAGSVLCQLSLGQIPCQIISNPQCVHEEMGVNIGRQPPQRRWEEPCDPRPTDSLQWAIATLSYSPVLGNRDLCHLQGHWAHTCLYAELLAVPDAEGQWEVRDTGPGLSGQPSTNTAC